MKFIIIHGAFGSPEGNWFPQLKDKLEALGQEVIVPQFPVEDWSELTKKGATSPPKNQSLLSWLKVFREEVLTKIKRGEKVCFIGHSLGPVFTLHVVEKYNIQLDCAIFVIPFMDFLKSKKYWQFDLVNKSFYKKNFDFNKLKKLIPISYVLYSDSDPYVDKKYPLDFAKRMGSSVIYVTKAGHLNSEVNLNEFPLVLELCKTRLDLSLYQKYLAHRSELLSVDYIGDKTEEVIYISPKEVFDEGIFHFRNLRRDGFCTLFTGSTFWDAESKYMTEARKAAKRTGNIQRVYIVENKKDLDRIDLRTQIDFDIKGGIQVYFCWLDKVKKQLPEPDFGIWDDEYLCMVRFNKNKKASEVKISSRKKDIKEALVWKDIILKYAVRIQNLDWDIKSFIKKN